jgi:heme-degrading monooxygenase HmoA
MATTEQPDTARAALDDDEQTTAGPVTAVFSRRAKPGKEAEFERWAREVMAAATRWPGHLGASVLHEPGSPYYHIVYKFSDRDRFKAWIHSDERQRWLGEVEKLTEDDLGGLQLTTGLETWFDLPGPEGAPGGGERRGQMGGRRGGRRHGGRCGWSPCSPSTRWWLRSSGRWCPTLSAGRSCSRRPYSRWCC